MKWEFQLALYDLMKRDERVFLLWADVGVGLFKKHIADFPCRTLNVGICEQATISMAAGMAMQSLRPIVYSITPFLVERAFEQIKLDVDQMKQPVGIVGHSDASCGPTHIELNARLMIGLCSNIGVYTPNKKGDVKQFLDSYKQAPDVPWFMTITTL